MNRIYHTWDKWECYPAGFYESTAPKGMSKEDCERAYAQLLSDEEAFAAALNRVTTEWARSCEHYLSNEKMNRIAWLGQASLCIAKSIPANYRGGFNLLTVDQQAKANALALAALNRWLESHGESAVDMEKAGVSAKADIY